MKYLFDLVAILVAAVIVFLFARRGLIKSIFRLAKWIFAFFAAYLFGGKLADFLCGKWFYKGFLASFTEKIQSLYDGATAGFNGDVVYEKLPFFLQTEGMKEKLAAIESGDGMVGEIADAVATAVARLVSNVVGYLVIFLVALVALWVVVILLDKIVKLSVITKLINGILGGVLGAFLAFLLLFVAVSILRAFFSDSEVYANSFLVKWISGIKFLQNFRIFNIGERWFAGIR